MSVSGRSILCGLAVVAVGLTSSERAVARPLYFENLTQIYGFTRGDDLHACGVCHRKWQGTGGRNPFGTAVEQQLYIGNTIVDAILAVEPDDTDLDGFTNFEELATFGTLPGYSCDTYELVIDPPENFQSLITPGVESCLESMDLKVEPVEIAFITEVGLQDTVVAELINNGTDFPITVSAVEIANGDPSLVVSGMALPLVILVGATASVDVTFAPTASRSVSTTLRVTSDDPDEPVIDVPISGLGLVLPSASAAERAACLSVIDRQYRGYSKRYMKEWTRCFVDEVRGRACDAGRRDLKASQAEEKFRSYIGGSRDKDCVTKGMSPGLLKLPILCGAPCGDVSVTSMAAFADCLVCRQEGATSAMLSAAVGFAPPDLPEATGVSKAAVCQKVVAKAANKAISAAHRTLADCELANIGTESPVDCPATKAAELTELADKVNSRVERCKDTTGLQGCPFVEDADPNCLGAAALSIGAGLVETSYGVTFE